MNIEADSRGIGCGVFVALRGPHPVPIAGMLAGEEDVYPTVVGESYNPDWSKDGRGQSPPATKTPVATDWF